MASNILVLGATGFIGGVVSQKLRSQYLVHTPTRHELDLTDTKSVSDYFANKTFDVVINCAASLSTQLSPFDPAVVNVNLSIFSNLYAVRGSFNQLINFGSGAEFDRSTNIDQISEEHIFNAVPVDHYGLSKNIIARMIANTDNFYTLRLFGVFGPTEHPSRLLRQIIAGNEIVIHDRYFDYFYVNDLLMVLDHYINHTPKHKDINVVYTEKILLSDFLTQFCNLHRLPSHIIKLSNRNGLNYTGSSEKIQQLQLPFMGITQGLKDYI